MGHGGRYETALQTPLTPSPGPGTGMDTFGNGDEAGGRGSAKRQRTGNSMGAMNGDDPNGMSGMNGVLTGPGGVGVNVGVNGVGVGVGVSKKGSRARSDSAPLGYGLSTGWTQTRPRSGSGLGQRIAGASARREEVQNIGSFTRGHVLPLLSIPKQSPS